ncbi:hypothetical protein MD535_15170 [Vibrio sp. ZSDZ65]|uniref:Uncharacterized protein n=1 Tax=Vibrio qingdaonensis TaxID=2829491 RepID=A0A9X3HY03_9VIBR|nr:hypothetical protein [Vibrio qingdaonensis]MCW8347347.1 hypothetical protein [Vibrio qingdaonensis]
MQSNVSWTFKAGGSNVTTESNKMSAKHYGAEVPSVMMTISSLRNGSTNALLFDTKYDFPQSGKESNFNFPLRAQFQTLQSSPSGSYSFNLNFQVDYN